MSFQPSVTSELLELLVLHFKHLLMDSAATHSPLILSNYTPYHSHHIWAAKVKKLTLPVLQNFKERRKPYALPDSAPALSTSDFSHHNMHLKHTQFFLPPQQAFLKEFTFIDPTNKNEGIHIKRWCSVKLQCFLLCFLIICSSYYAGHHFTNEGVPCLTLCGHKYVLAFVY